MDLLANIKGIKYRPLLIKELPVFNLDNIVDAFKKSVFKLKIDNDEIAVSWWVSPKRTRSYPYARVYDTLDHNKKLTIIPIVKDEGFDGDRDFLQWDTIALMSLLGVYVIIGYYKTAIKSHKFKNKITNQVFDYNYLKNEILRLIDYKSDALHWNLEQIKNIDKIMYKAYNAYKAISKLIRVKLHSFEGLESRLIQLKKGLQRFLELSRDLAQRAQLRETKTLQPKEKITFTKASITIKNYLGGFYFLTVDEVLFKNDILYLIESKFTRNKFLPSLEDIKDGLLKMVIFTNLSDVTLNNKKFKHRAVLNLYNNQNKQPSDKEKEIINNLKEEAKINNFDIWINGNEL